MTKSEMFKTAWKMARFSANMFGGSVKSYFAECLKAEYVYLAINKAAAARDKMFSENGISEIRRWENNDKSRVYFKAENKRYRAAWYMDCITNEFFMNDGKDVAISAEVRSYFIKNYGSQIPMTQIKEILRYDAEEVLSGITDLVA